MTTKTDHEKEIRTLKAEIERLNAENEVLRSKMECGEKKEDDFDVVRSSRLWSGISHEILTPMDAILGMTELVLDSDLSEEQQNSIEMIHTSADRLFSVLSDVIDYSDIQEGRLRRDVGTFTFREELEYDLYVAELSAKHCDLTFSQEFSSDIPEILKGDPARLRQVLNTLIGNAIANTREGGVAVKVESEGYDDKGRLVLLFSVKGGVLGVSANTSKQLFSNPATEHFFSDDEKYSEESLGLVVAARLVSLFEGEIGVKNNKGGGTTFWFTWPLENPAHMHMGEIPPELKAESLDVDLVFKGARVLLADDEYINASITKALLEQAGLNVKVVTDGGEAVKAVEEEHFHAILMDVQMPLMDGLEATRKIRGLEKGAGGRCPIIALTAHAMEGDRERCLQAGMDDYLPKPLDKGQLIDMLARYMKKRALIVGSDLRRQEKIIQPLVERGWSVVLAETGKTAMYEASLQYFDMIIVDSSLSSEDAIIALTAIRQLEKYSGCRAMVLVFGSNKGGFKGVDVDKFLVDEEAIAVLSKTVESFQ